MPDSWVHEQSRELRAEARALRAKSVRLRREREAWFSRQFAGQLDEDRRGGTEREPVGAAPGQAG